MSNNCRYFKNNSLKIIFITLSDEVKESSVEIISSMQSVECSREEADECINRNDFSIIARSGVLVPLMPAVKG